MAKREGLKRARPMIRLADIALEVGVDQSTVSRVLRRDPRAKTTDETRTRIIETTKRLGYVPNAAARSLVSKRTHTIGLLVPQPLTLSFTGIIKGATDAAREFGYVLMVADGSEMGAANDAINSLVLAGRVEGLLIASGHVTDKITNDVLAGFGNVVVLNRRISGGAPSVTEDDAQGMMLITDELIAHGHHRLACITGPRDIDTAQRRLDGFRRACRAAGIRGAASARGTFSETGGYQAMKALLERREPPTGVACASLAAAVGAMASVRQAGLSIPHDLSITAFHDAELANYLYPALTTVAMPLEALGHEAVAMLHRRLERLPGPDHVEVKDPPPQLVRRASVAPPPS